MTKYKPNGARGFVKDGFLFVEYVVRNGKYIRPKKGKYLRIPLEELQEKTE